MAIKLIGGEFRGFPLAAPRTETTRPTSILVRRKLFDWRQNLEGFSFVDLCAGSGAMGFEALSRGADKIYLNESQKIAFYTLKDNKEKIIKSFRVPSENMSITQLDARKWVSKEMAYQITDTENTIIYMDPPYEDHALYFDLLNSLKEQNFQGEVWVESDLKKGPAVDKITGAFHSVVKEISQGDHFVVVGFLL